MKAIRGSMKSSQSRKTLLMFLNSHEEPLLLDIDECSAGKHNCSAKAVCSNNKGSYCCNCKSGYSGDGRTCEGKLTIVVYDNWIRVCCCSTTRDLLILWKSYVVITLWNSGINLVSFTCTGTYVLILDGYFPHWISLIKNLRFRRMFNHWNPKLQCWCCVQQYQGIVQVLL